MNFLGGPGSDLVGWAEGSKGTGRDGERRPLGAVAGIGA